MSCVIKYKYRRKSFSFPTRNSIISSPKVGGGNCFQFASYTVGIAQICVCTISMYQICKPTYLFFVDIVDTWAQI